MDSLTCDPFLSPMIYPKFIVSYQVEESISIQRVKQYNLWIILVMICIRST